MSPSLPRRCHAASVVCIALLVCAAPPRLSAQGIRQPSPAASLPDEESPSVVVTRYGRYTLVELVPEPAQRDLLQQVIEVAVPPLLDATVGDGLRHVLLRTGYRLCETAEVASLYALPLPAAHLHLGPLPLRDALVTLGGPAWVLTVDDADRQVCFRRAASPLAQGAGAAPASAAAASAVPAASQELQQ